MKGSVLMGGTLLIAATAGLGLWYTSERAYYYEVTDVSEVMAYGDAFPVSDYQGIDADTSPLKMRACFKVDWDYWPSDEFKDVAEPLVAPKWFDCFNAKSIANDLAAGVASAILSNENNPFGFDTYIAQYPDGRAFMWRQINECGAAKFAGDELPAGCPLPDGTVQTAKGFDIKLTPIGAEAEVVPALNPIAVADPNDPLSFRACFEIEMSLALATETYVVRDTVDPQVAEEPACFKADEIRDDVASGKALAVLGEANIAPNIDRLVALYDDGRAFAWHQRSE